MVKRMKGIKIVVLAMAFCLVFVMAACGNNNTGGSGGSEPAPAPEPAGSSADGSDASEPAATGDANNDDLEGDQIGYDYGLGKVYFDLDGLVERMGADRVAGLHIGVNVNNATSSWTKQWGERWVELQEKYGFQATILYANDDSVKEADNIATFINQQVDGIAVSPIGPTTAAPVGQAWGKIPTLACIPIDGGNVNVTVNVDQQAKGRMIADRVAEDANGAEVHVLAMDIMLDMPNLHDRVTGFKAQCEEKYPNIKVVDEVRELNADAFINLATASFQAHPEINAVLTTFSEPLKGAYQAKVSLGRDDIKLYGVDADEATLQLLEQGEINGMHVQFANVQADTCLFYLLRLINGDTVPEDVWEDDKYAMHYSTPEDAYLMLSMWYPDKYPPK